MDYGEAGFSPRKIIKAERVGMVWVEFVMTLIILLKGPGENTVKARKIVLW